MIDINCDVGEGMNNEEELFPFITSCNIACGGHAGDSESMRSVVRLAKKYDVLVGAHPSYPDTANFGRVSMTIEKADLIKSIQSQITALVNICEEEGVRLNHIKAHGALYNNCVRNEGIAKIFLEAITPFKKSRFIFVPDGSVIAELVNEGSFHPYYEGFADRAYQFDLSLVPRSEMFSVITDVQQVVDRVEEMRNGFVQTEDGKREISVETFCVHSDTEDAVAIVRALHERNNLTYKIFGNQGIIIEWPQELKLEHLYNRLAFYNDLQKHYSEFEMVHAVNSITILGIDKNSISELKRMSKNVGSTTSEYSRYKIPVCYNTEFGLDLEALAAEKELSEEELIALHTEKTYPVYSGGFLPGFLYLGGLNEQLHAPRLAEPRLKIPAGSVGIGGVQTGIYPQESPGGWRIIGKTPVQLFDINRTQANLAKAGDEIQFYPISRAEFDELEGTDFKIEREVFHA